MALKLKDNYLKSTDIQIFPSSVDRSSDLSLYNGRILSENNIARLIAATNDSDCFVIERGGTNTEDKEDYITFMMRGRLIRANIYSFTYDSSKSPNIPTNNDLFAGITLSASETADAFIIIVDGADRQDDVDEDDDRDTPNPLRFTGVKFATTESALDSCTYTLQLLETGQVPAKSYCKLTHINGGTV